MTGNIKTAEFIDNKNMGKERPIFRRSILHEFPDIPLYAANLYNIYKKYGNSNGLNYVSEVGNKIIVSGKIDIDSLKRTTIYLNGNNNSMTFDDLRNVFKLDVACVKESNITINSPNTIRGLTIFCSHGSSVAMRANCMVARDVLIYSSKAHGLYSVVDGSRRFKQGVDIGQRVWLGQGARILAGARVGNGSVIGSYSVLAGRIPNNCAAAGNPCRVTTKDIFWTGKAVPNDGNYFEMLKQINKEMPEFIKMTED
ncbi:acyltransferase [Ancylobacter oerskovii]|uniref:Acyltransferase n=1 Tax=Ancylobacter oerskovii TaxID=459519 RepID=A0ABW4Z4H1_9HYPH|nr:hypothetical protein [Ancylobacter oerskovii]MBS7543036.1 hypothetical protein [Ancylobacter oerskovii]